MEVRLIDIAEVIRSKNSGPFELTFDIIFKDWEIFDKACRSKFFNKKLFARLYGIEEEKVMEIVEFKPAKAIKATIVRSMSSGELGETDVYGAQQHAPLMDLTLEL